MRLPITHTICQRWSPQVSEWFDSLPHPVSSLPSVQSCVPSQRPEELIHWALLHRNAPFRQNAEQNVTR